MPPTWCPFSHHIQSAMTTRPTAECGRREMIDSISVRWGRTKRCNLLDKEACTRAYTHAHSMPVAPPLTRAVAYSTSLHLSRSLQHISHGPQHKCRSIQHLCHSLQHLCHSPQHHCHSLQHKCRSIRPPSRSLLHRFRSLQHTCLSAVYTLHA